MQRLQRGRGSSSAEAAQSEDKWQMTVLQGASAVLTAAGAFNIIIRPQFNFVAQDFSMDGTTAGSNVTSILFGDHVVFQNAAGIPVITVNATSFIRGLVKGAKIPGGLSQAVDLGAIRILDRPSKCRRMGVGSLSEE